MERLNKDRRMYDALVKSVASDKRLGAEDRYVGELLIAECERLAHLMRVG